MKPCLIAIVLALGAFDAGAQTIFKSTMPDGKVVYGEKPAPGAQKVDKLEPPPATTGVTAVTPEERREQRTPGRNRQPPQRRRVNVTPKKLECSCRKRKPRAMQGKNRSRRSASAEPAAAVASRKNTSRVRKRWTMPWTPRANAWKSLSVIARGCD